MNKLIASVVLGVSLVMLLTPKASAHVLLTDKHTGSSAILHITPDDDPEAGKDAELYFEIQSTVPKNTYDEYRLYITNDTGEITELAVHATDTGVSTHYVFPTQALYKLELKNPVTKNRSFDLMYSLRVSRGVATGSSQVTEFGWTEPVMVFTVGAAALLLIVGFNNRKEIFTRSTF